MQQPDHSQRVAVIDLGSNTARLIVMQATFGFAYRLVDEIREVVRLRQKMTPAGLSDKAIQRALSTLRLFKHFCDHAEVDLILPTATSAVREAANGPAFVEQVEREIGLHLQVLDGRREAYYGTLGALNEIPLEAGFVLDVGGGSAQVSEVRDGRFLRGEALTLGTLALSERFVHHDPIQADEVEAIQQEIGRQLDTLPWCRPNADATLVGLGGTVRNLAWMDAARRRYPLQTLHGYPLGRDALQTSIEALQDLALAQRRRLPGLKSDRADIILPGALVLQAVMQRLDVEQVTVSVSGLREGVFMERFWQERSYPVAGDVRQFGVLNLARIYGYQGEHVAHMRFLCALLFEQLEPLHHYGRNELALLDAAAVLHDIGSIIGYAGHHRHTQTLIETNGLPGFSPREVALVALLARYHRKGMPVIRGYELLLPAGDRRLLRQLSAILRLAEYLERGRHGAIRQVEATWTDTTLTLRLHANEYPLVEMWQAQRHALPLLRAAYQRRVELQVAEPSP